MRFRVNWYIDGPQIGRTYASHPVPNGYPNPPCRFHRGDIVEAHLSEVAHLVAAKFGGHLKSSDAVLTPVDETGERVNLPGESVDLASLSNNALNEHAKKYHGLTLFQGHAAWCPRSYCRCHADRNVAVNEIIDCDERTELLTRITEARKTEATQYA